MTTKDAMNEEAKTERPCELRSLLKAIGAVTKAAKDGSDVASTSPHVLLSPALTGCLVNAAGRAVASDEDKALSLLALAVKFGTLRNIPYGEDGEGRGYTLPSSLNAYRLTLVQTQATEKKNDAEPSGETYPATLPAILNADLPLGIVRLLLGSNGDEAGADVTSSNATSPNAVSSNALHLVALLLEAWRGVLAERTVGESMRRKLRRGRGALLKAIRWRMRLLGRWGKMESALPILYLSASEERSTEQNIIANNPLQSCKGNFGDLQMLCALASGVSLLLLHMSDEVESKGDDEGEGISPSPASSPYPLQLTPSHWLPILEGILRVELQSGGDLGDNDDDSGNSSDASSDAPLLLQLSVEGRLADEAQRISAQVKSPPTLSSSENRAEMGTWLKTLLILRGRLLLEVVHRSPHLLPLLRLGARFEWETDEGKEGREGRSARVDTEARTASASGSLMSRLLPAPFKRRGGRRGKTNEKKPKALQAALQKAELEILVRQAWERFDDDCMNYAGFPLVVIALSKMSTVADSNEENDNGGA